MSSLEITQLLSFNQFPGTFFGQENFANWANNVVDNIKEVNHQQSQIGSPRERVVVIVSGKPRSGKSHLTTLTRTYLSGALSNESVNYHFQHLSYERDGETKARKFGRIQTEPRKPFTEQELDAADEELEDEVFFSLGRYSQGLSMEIPATTSLELSSGRFGRVLGTRTFEHLLAREGMFNSLEIPYRTFVISCISGFWPKVLSLYREDINQATTLDEAQETALLYGNKPPDNDKEWAEHKNEGASLGQIAVIKRQTEDLYAALEDILPIPRYEFINFTIPEELRSLIPLTDLAQIYESWWYEMQTSRYILEERLKVPSSNVLITLNNPPTSELAIPDINKLLERIKQKGYQRLF